MTFLKLSGIQKRFGGIQALAGPSFEVPEGVADVGFVGCHR